ncbi:MAG TPA: hypothetical protein VK610_06145, partial [Rhodothermales bacterium]|nr:hypothetical protein [Rhodothermales bacterium]
MRRFYSALGLALLALSVLRPAAAQVAPGTVLDGVIAVVDDGVILRSDVEAVAAQFARGAAVTDA